MDYHSDFFYYYHPPPSLSPSPSPSFDEDRPPLAEETWSDRSSGYLEDAVVGWAGRCKRRRLLLFQNGVDEPDDDEHLQGIIQEFWNWGPDVQLFEGWSNPSDAPRKIDAGNAKDNVLYGECTVGPTDGMRRCAELTTSHERYSPPASNGGRRKKKKKKNSMVGVVHPFTVVKPADVDGRVTLEDINRRILSRPTRPIRHPVGRFACLPCVTAVSGPGLSGKMVVSLTRIHTRGRGTITIIRTRG